MNYQKVLGVLTNKLATFPSVEGAFLSGSLVNQFQDEFSDIDLGVVTKNSTKAFSEIFTLRHQLITAVGEPSHFLERGWEHCKMIAALYGRSQFPPIGLEIDIIFSQLRHGSEQMPYSEYRIVFDRYGKLQPMLAKMSQSKPSQEIENEIVQHLKWFLFYAHDALKACKRGDAFQVQSLLEEIRKMIFFAAATRQGEQVYGAKRAYRYLSTIERHIVEDSYHHSDENMVARLTQLYLECVTVLQSDYRIRDNVENTRIALQELL
jgi:predicted nucleotidyltransferase